MPVRLVAREQFLVSMLFLRVVPDLPVLRLLRF
jgi:hypothetical protein